MTLLDEPRHYPAPPPEAVPPLPEPPLAEVVARACPNCGSGLADEQDWCLECGEAATDRLGGLPGWRTAVSVLAITAVLASGAVAAAYAALKADSRQAASSTAQAALPPQAPPAAQPAPAAVPPPSAATPPAAEIPASSDQARKDTDSSKPPPAAAAVPAAATPSASVPGPAKDPSSRPARPVRSKGPLQAIALSESDARTYNPDARPTSTFGKPGNALDDDPATSWTADLQKAGGVAGLIVDLDDPTSLRRLTLRTSTPGITIEVYATKSQTTPVSVLAENPGWEHLDTRLDVPTTDKIPLAGLEKYRKVLLWITEGPPEGGPQVAISEISLFS